MTRIAVLGPGGVGGFVAAALTRAGEDVTVVAREATAERIERDCIDVSSALLGEFTARPRALTGLSAPIEVLIVATKSSGLGAALDRIQADPDIVVPLLNGLDHMRVLRERFDAARVAAGTIRIESDRPRPGAILQTSPSVRVELAAADPALRDALQWLAASLRLAGIPAALGSGEAQVLWSKLVRLNALACTTSAADRTIGFIRSDPEWRRTLERCLAETAAVANADGAQIDPADLLDELDAAHAELGSSMRRDIAAGHEPELDAIPGSVLRAARQHHIECPTIERLTARIAERAGMPSPLCDGPIDESVAGRRRSESGPRTAA
jgi:2-dehydropantoate 2-reductase